MCRRIAFVRCAWSQDPACWTPGTVQWRHVDSDFTRRAEPADLAAALRR